MIPLSATPGGLASLVAVFLVLSLVTTVLRFYARHIQSPKKLWWDDGFVAASLLGFVGMSILLIIGLATHLFGYPAPHSRILLVQQHPMQEILSILTNFLSVWTLGMTKLAALFFYRRVFCTKYHHGPDPFSIATWVMIGFVVAWLITFITFSWTICGGSRDVINELNKPNGVCDLVFPYFEAVSITDFILDVFIIFMVFPKIWALEMTRNRKMQVSAVFLLAFAGLGASCGRMVIYILGIRYGKPADLDSYQYNTHQYYFDHLEAGICLVTVNLPSLSYFISGKSAEKMLASVRSVMSLESLRAYGTGASRQASEPNGKSSECDDGSAELAIEDNKRGTKGPERV